MYFITPSSKKIESALESWHWIGLEDCEALSITAFGDIFFKSANGIKFLDTLEGVLTMVASDEDDLQQLLDTDEGKDNFLLTSMVDRAVSEGLILEPNQCYGFVVPPILGGPISYENIQCQDFVVAINIAGQIHKQIKDLPPGTKIDRITINDGEP